MYVYIYKYLLIFPLILVINPTMDNWSIIYYQFIITNEFLSYMINISDTYISIYISIHICIYTYMYIYIDICMHTYIHTYMHTYKYIYIHIIYIFVCRYIVFFYPYMGE